MKFKSFFQKLCVTIFVFALFLLTVSAASPSVAFKLNASLCDSVRNFLSRITSLFRFSVFEASVIFSPIIIFFVIRYIGKEKGKSARLRFMSVLSVLSLIPTLYVFTLAIPNKAESKAETLLQTDVKIKDEDVIFSAMKLLKFVNKFPECNEKAPTFSKIRDELTRSYTSILNEKETFPRIKPLLSSKIMSYTGILALYSFPTGEVNINTEIPEYMIPFTVAHEYAHCIGAASEGEANFLAFIAAVKSENEYIRYSGALCALEYLLADLYCRAPDSYSEIYSALSERAKGDMLSYTEYSKRYQNGIIYYLSDKLNSHYLEKHDPHGKASYSAAVKLISSYIKTNNISILRIKYSKTTVFRSIEWDNSLYTAESRSAVKFR